MEQIAMPGDVSVGPSWKGPRTNLPAVSILVS